MNRRIVIVGGGLGGMSAAITLAKTHDVTLVEKNDHLGGKLNEEKRDGFTFDLGPSILTMPHIFEKLFTMHDKRMEDYVEIEPVRPHWRNFFEDGTIIDLPASLDKVIENADIREEDMGGLHSFYRYAEKLYQFSNKVYFENESERKLHTLKHYNPFKIIPHSDMSHTMDEGVRKYIDNPYLVEILNFFIKYVGSSPFDAPAILNLLPYIQWKFDLWSVKDGMHNLAKGMERLMEEVGVTIVKNQHIKSVEKKDGRIVRLYTDDAEYETDQVISNMEVIPFYEEVTKEPDERIKPYREKYPPACSGFALHLGVGTQYEQLAHHNFFYAKEQRAHFDSIFKHHTLSDDPTIYLVAPMKSDPSLGPQGSEIIKILPHIPVIDDEKPFTEEEYSAFKTHVLDKLERMGLKDLRKHIVTETLWTPETIREMYRSNKGSIYGVLSDKKINLGFKTPKQSAFYENLLFVGGSVNPGGGMPMAVLSGQQAAGRLM